MQHGIVADEVGQRQGTDRVVHAQLHDAVNGLGFSDPLLQGQDGFVDHGTKDSVGNKARGVVARQSGFAHLLGRFNHGCVGALTGLRTVDDLNEFHDGYRVHEVHADDLVRPIGRLSDGADGNR